VLIPERVLIHDRPEAINKRSEFGHFEGNLTFCKGNRSVKLLILTERVTKMSFIIKNNSKHATKVGKNCFNALSKIDQNARKTINLIIILNLLIIYYLENF
jgi:IS30 family transposase